LERYPLWGLSDNSAAGVFWASALDGALFSDDSSLEDSSGLVTKTTF